MHGLKSNGLLPYVKTTFIFHAGLCIILLNTWHASLKYRACSKFLLTNNITTITIHLRVNEMKLRSQRTVVYVISRVKVRLLSYSLLYVKTNE